MTDKNEALNIIDRYCEEMPSEVAKKVLKMTAQAILVDNYEKFIPDEVMNIIQAESQNPSESFSVEDKSDFNVTNHPKRYLNKSGIEAIDVIELIVADISGPAGFNVGTMVKYLARLGKKTEDVKEEWNKVMWYAKRALTVK
ncbi:MAG: DUF3310 domain-containing protein [Treponema sp.]|nr:DUF3310 domain-containing protein [Treponema sp.]